MSESAVYIYNDGLASGIADEPSVPPEIYPYLSNEWQLWMGGHARGALITNTMTQLRQALVLAEPALEHSLPVMRHYPEPIERHKHALAAVRHALALFQPEATARGNNQCR